MRHKLSFKCEYCDETGTHVCLDRLINHFAMTIQQMMEDDYEAALAFQDQFLDPDMVWWEDELGDDFWESEEELDEE